MRLAPKTHVGGRNLEFDFPSFHIGLAEYEEGPTGCTVFDFPHGASTVIDARGGLVGKTGDYEWNHAICLAGGSLPGLEAAAGVSAALWDRHERSLDGMPLVSGAIIFDYGRRESRIYPDMALGRAALLTARPGVFPIGERGAGRSANCGGVLDLARSEPSGQGGAFRQVGSTKMAAFCVVNSLGVVLGRAGQVVRGNKDPENGEREHPLASLERHLEQGKPIHPPAQNTTLSLVVTNRKLDRRELTQFARQVHTSIGRFIYPFHTLLDGDILYAITTDEVQYPELSVAALGMLASELMWDAVLSI
jgi:L-aminopeptidase/D-esterase-like protein